MGLRIMMNKRKQRLFDEKESFDYDEKSIRNISFKRVRV